MRLPPDRKLQRFYDRYNRQTDGTTFQIRIPRNLRRQGQSRSHPYELEHYLCPEVVEERLRSLGLLVEISLN